MSQTARYAMTREVAALSRFFPLSMSDFKPGDKEYCVHGGAKHCMAVMAKQYKLFCHIPGGLSGMGYR